MVTARVATPAPRFSFADAAFVRLLSRPFDLKRPAAMEVLAVLILCALDMYSTIYWVRMGEATEANPLLAWTFDIHPIVFVLLKAATFLPAVVLAAFMARHRPRMVTFLLRSILLAYIGIYLVGVFR